MRGQCEGEFGGTVDVTDVFLFVLYNCVLETSVKIPGKMLNDLASLLWLTKCCKLTSFCYKTMHD